MSQFKHELRALAEASASRLRKFQPVILRGFTQGVPSKVNLWDMKPRIPDDLTPTQREAKFHRNLDFLAKKFKANNKQIKTTENLYSALAGLTLVYNSRKIDKTIIAIL